MFQLLRPKNADLEAGFTAVELTFAVAIASIVCVIAFEAYFNALPSMRANSAMQLLEGALRQARESSIDQRRNFTVTFQGTSELVGAVQNVPCSGPNIFPCFDYFLPEGFVYVVFSTIGDTPDLYCSGQQMSPVTYYCPNSTLPCTITFQSDGSVLDGGGGSGNGSIFIGLTGQPATARAVTILSATGKIKGWHYTGTGWN
jgi:type II secretory pathway pseudopilin PulG